HMVERAPAIWEIPLLVTVIGHGGRDAGRIVEDADPLNTSSSSHYQNEHKLFVSLSERAQALRLTIRTSTSSSSHYQNEHKLFVSLSERAQALRLTIRTSTS